MRRALLLLGVAALALAVVPAATAGSGTGDVRFFRTAAKDTYCTASFFPGSSPASVSCSSRVPLARPTPKGPPRQCIGDPGNALLVGHRGRARGLCLSQSPFAGPTGRNYVGFHVLRYGKTMAFHGIHCHAVSPKLGIRCVNATGHGFRMGGGTWRLF
jgi:hypothetical protein